MKGFLYALRNNVNSVKFINSKTDYWMNRYLYSVTERYKYALSKHDHKIQFTSSHFAKDLMGGSNYFHKALPKESINYIFDYGVDGTKIRVLAYGELSRKNWDVNLVEAFKVGFRQGSRNISHNFSTSESIVEKLVFSGLIYKKNKKKSNQIYDKIAQSATVYNENTLPVEVNFKYPPLPYECNEYRGVIYEANKCYRSKIAKILKNLNVSYKTGDRRHKKYPGKKEFKYQFTLQLNSAGNLSLKSFKAYDESDKKYESLVEAEIIKRIESFNTSQMNKIIPAIDRQGRIIPYKTSGVRKIDIKLTY